MQDALDETPVEGAKICAPDTTICTTTDANGLATLELPTDQRLLYTIEKEGYGSVLWTLVMPKDATVAEGRAFMEPDEWLADNFTNLQSDYPLEDKGAIQVRTTNRFAGLTLKLAGATGTRFYTDEEDNWRSDLEATTSGGSGADRRLLGGFVDVVPGDHQVEIGGMAGDCSPTVDRTGYLVAWPAEDEDNRFEVPVRAGFFTRLSVVCSAPF